MWQYSRSPTSPAQSTPSLSVAQHGGLREASKALGRVIWRTHLGTREPCHFFEALDTVTKKSNDRRWQSLPEAEAKLEMAKEERITMLRELQCMEKQKGREAHVTKNTNATQHYPYIL